MPSYWCMTGTSGPAKGVTWTISSEPLAVGRSRQCQIFVPDSSVSRHHCEFVLRDGRAVVRDLGSANGTLVNGRPVTDAKLSTGDEIAVGPSIFLVTRLHHEPKPGGEPASPLHDEHTTTIPIGGGGEGTSTASGAVDARPRTVQELAALFDIGRELVHAATVVDLVEILRRRVSERFDVASFWLGRCHGADDQFLALTGKDSDAMPVEAMARALREQRPILVPTRGGRDGDNALYVAPILCGGMKVGAIAVTGRGSNTISSESNLLFLMALAYEAAPFFLSIERIEQLNRDIERLRVRAGESTSLVGQSDAIRRVRQILQEAAQSNLSVLLLGETGTGKELAARIIHDYSRRAKGPFVAVNCAAIPSTLFESEMFGHERGAFTGAARMNAGRVQQAHGGTLFLDEIGELTLESQARILRLVEHGTFYRIGATHETKVDIRFVAATNRDIPALARQGQFREDLYHRLNGLEIRMPSLRERPTDIPILATHFLEQCREEAKRPIRGLDLEAMAYLRERPWPGNVRELRRCIERAVALAVSDVITVEDLMRYDTSPCGDEPEKLRSLAEVERAHIESVLRACGGKVSEAAQTLGIGRSTLYNKISEYEIAVES